MMSWPCYMVTPVDLAEERQVYPDNPSITTRRVYRLADGTELLFRELKVGAMWIAKPNGDERFVQRSGLCVKLPGENNGQIWAMEEEGSLMQEGRHAKWTVTGTAPNVSATPSINCVGRYHGWVTNGVVSDDCEGRKFDDFGKLTT